MNKKKKKKKKRKEIQKVRYSTFGNFYLWRLCCKISWCISIDSGISVSLFSGIFCIFLFPKWKLYNPHGKVYSCELRSRYIIRTCLGPLTQQNGWLIHFLPICCQKLFSNKQAEEAQAKSLARA